MKKVSQKVHNFFGLSPNAGVCKKTGLTPWKTGENTFSDTTKLFYSVFMCQPVFGNKAKI